MKTNELKNNFLNGALETKSWEESVILRKSDGEETAERASERASERLHELAFRDTQDTILFRNRLRPFVIRVKCLLRNRKRPLPTHC